MVTSRSWGLLSDIGRLLLPSADLAAGEDFHYLVIDSANILGRGAVRLLDRRHEPIPGLLMDDRAVDEFRPEDLVARGGQIFPHLTAQLGLEAGLGPGKEQPHGDIAAGHPARG